MRSLSDTPPQRSEAGAARDSRGVEDDVLETDGKGQLARLAGRGVLAGEERTGRGEARRRFDDGGL